MLKTENKNKLANQIDLLDSWWCTFNADKFPILYGCGHTKFSHLTP